MTARIDWPAGLERTPASERTRNRHFEVTLAKAVDDETAKEVLD